MSIITHNDIDGLVSALVAMELSGQRPQDVHFFSYGPDRDEKWNSLLVHHKSSFQMSDNDVWFVDMSLRPGELEHARLPHKASKWHWVDHHKSSLEFNPDGIFDEVYLEASGENCAADMLWALLLTLKGKPTSPHLKSWVEAAHDRDLWINRDRKRGMKLNMILRWMLRDTERIQSFLDDCIRRSPGEIINIYDTHWLEGMKSYDNSCKTAQTTSTIFTMTEEPHIPIIIAWINGHASDVADILYEAGDEIIVMLQLSPENVGINFRTKRDDVDLSMIAKAFNGGGHPQAAGGRLEHRHLKNGYTMVAYEIMEILKEK